jgi:hypothetical protein
VRSSIPLQIATGIGLVGGVIFTGTVAMEVSVIPKLTLACRSSPGCLSQANAPFADELADQGWRVLPGLIVGGRLLMIGLALLTAIAFFRGALRIWEAAPIFGGSLVEIALDTGLHAWGDFSLQRGMPGLAAVGLLLGGAALSVRLVAEAWDVRPKTATWESTAPPAAAPAAEPPSAT